MSGTEDIKLERERHKLVPLSPEGASKEAEHVLEVPNENFSMGMVFLDLLKKLPEFAKMGAVLKIDDKYIMGGWTYIPDVDPLVLEETKPVDIVAACMVGSGRITSTTSEKLADAFKASGLHDFDIVDGKVCLVRRDSVNGDITATIEMKEVNPNLTSLFIRLYEIIEPELVDNVSEVSSEGDAQEEEYEVIEYSSIESGAVSTQKVVERRPMYLEQKEKKSKGSKKSRVGRVIAPRRADFKNAVSSVALQTKANMKGRMLGTAESIGDIGSNIAGGAVLVAGLAQKASGPMNDRVYRRVATGLVNKGKSTPDKQRAIRSLSPYAIVTGGKVPESASRYYRIIVSEMNEDTPMPDCDRLVPIKYSSISVVSAAVEAAVVSSFSTVYVVTDDPKIMTDVSIASACISSGRIAVFKDYPQI